MYANPQLPQEINDINVTKTNPLLDLIKDLFTFILIVAVFLIGVFLGVRYLAQYLPFSYEVKLANALINVMPNSKNEVKTPVELYLQDLADKLLVPINKNKSVTLNIHLMENNNIFMPGSSMNAFAILGGNIFYGEDLLCSVKSENALAMVMAHEASHVTHRDVIRQMAASLITSLSFSVLTGGMDAAASSAYIQQLISLKFSRIQEIEADNDGLMAISAYYGHALGAEEFFTTILQTESKNGDTTEILSTHPDTRARIENIKAIQAKYNNPKNTLTPIPEAVKTYCESRKQNPKLAPVIQ